MAIIDQIRHRFEDFVQKITRGKQPAKVRLIIKRSDQSEAPL
jgi:hypothetical protein